MIHVPRYHRVIMTTNNAQETSAQVGRILDALTALSVDMSCHCESPPDRLVLSAGRVRDACDAIDEAVSALKRVLQIAEANGGAVIPPDVLRRAGRAADEPRDNNA